MEAAGVERGVHGAEVEVRVCPQRRHARHDAQLRVVGLGPGTVAGGREVRNARSRHLVHRLRHDPVLEERLGRIDDVVHDDVGREAGQRVRRVLETSERADVVGEVDLAAVGGCETEACAGRDVMDDLQHRPPLVGPAARVLEHLDRLLAPGRIPDTRQVAGPDVVRRVRRRAVGVVAVRHRADRDAAAVDAGGQPVDAMLDQARAAGDAGIRVHGTRRDDREHALARRERGEGRGRHVGLDHALAVPEVAGLHLDAGSGLDRLQHRRGRQFAVQRDAHQRTRRLVEHQRVGELEAPRTARDHPGSLGVGGKRLRPARGRCDLLQAAAEIARHRPGFGDRRQQREGAQHGRHGTNCHGLPPRSNLRTLRSAAFNPQCTSAAGLRAGGFLSGRRRLRPGPAG